MCFSMHIFHLKMEKGLKTQSTSSEAAVAGPSVGLCSPDTGAPLCGRGSAETGVFCGIGPAMPRHGGPAGAVMDAWTSGTRSHCLSDQTPVTAPLGQGRICRQSIYLINV